MSSQAGPADDLPIWEVPILRPIELADHETPDGALVIYDPDVAGGRAHVIADTWVDTYDAR